MTKKFLTAICAACLLMTGCGENSQETQIPQATSAKVKEITPVKNSITIQINDKNFSATLEDKRSARAFADILPLEAEMTDLNGNEKYFYLEDDLPTDPMRILQIHAGDLMLYESNCVVIFYKDFETNYSYTRLGKLDNPADLEKTLGCGNVLVQFKK